VELAAWLLKLAGVTAEVQKEGGRDVWYIQVTTGMLATGHEELRSALAEVVREAIARGWVDASKAEGWLEELKRGLVLKEGWPRYEVGLAKGALVVRYRSSNHNNIEQEAHRLRDMGLVENVHFTVKMPEEGRHGYVYIRREGLAYAAWLSVYGEGGQQRLAADFVERILRRAREAGEEVHEKAREIVKEGVSRSSLKLEGFEKKVEVDGKTYVVKVIGGSAEIEESRRGKKLLRIRITAEVDGVRSEYTITYGRRSRDNAARGSATARGSTPSDREADAERFAAVVEALTGRKPWIIVRSNGKIGLVCGREHLEGFKRYSELTDAIEKWLRETGLR